jgi:GNAT superfamily N-acetyltransferase
MVRCARQSDTAAFGEIYAHAWKAAYQGILPDEYLDSLTAENCTPKAIAPEENAVARAAGKAAGLINFGEGREEKTGCGEIRAIYVLPEYWGKGCGKELFQYATEKLKEEGFKKAFLWVLKDNARARKFYGKMHMQCTQQERTLCISGKNVTEIKYELCFAE